MGECVSSELDGSADLGLYLGPPFSTAVPAEVGPFPVGPFTPNPQSDLDRLARPLLGGYSYATGTFVPPAGIDRFYALESIAPDTFLGGYSYALGTFVPPLSIVEGPS